MSHCEHERDVVFCELPCQCALFREQEKLWQKYWRDNWKVSLRIFTTDTDCSIFDLRIALKSTWLTSVWVMSIHCFDSRWVTPYLLRIFFQHAAIDQMWKLSLGSSLELKHCAPWKHCHVGCWEACVMRKNRLSHVSASFTEKCIVTFELSLHHVIPSCCLVDNAEWFKVIFKCAFIYFLTAHWLLTVFLVLKISQKLSHIKTN